MESDGKVINNVCDVQILISIWFVHFVYKMEVSILFTKMEEMDKKMGDGTLDWTSSPLGGQIKTFHGMLWKPINV